jgi:ribonucleoside-diphosphate reductase alpha chain
MYQWHTRRVTVYRDGSKDMQVLRVEHEDSPDTNELQEQGLSPDRISRYRLPDTRSAVNHSVDIAGHKLYISVGTYEDGSPGEVFIVANKSGSTTRGYLDAIGGLISLGLQYGVPVDDIASRLEGTRFEPAGFTGNGNIKVTSSPLDYIGRWLKERFHSGGKPSGESPKVSTGELCPDCDGILYAGEGCMMCISCGYSKCG